MARFVSSLQNPLIKNVLLLMEKPRARREQERIVIEGKRETMLAAAGGLRITDLIVCRELAGDHVLQETGLTNVPEAEVTEVPLQLYNRMAYRDDSSGLIALAVPVKFTFSDLDLPSNPLVLVLESVEKPGNLGAILRTADAAGLNAVIICDPQTDIFNPNVIRSSLGCIFTVPVITASTTETLEWLRKTGITSFGTALTAATLYHESDFCKPAAIIMGSEAFGLSGLWLSGANQLIRVPMNGKVDSMNVSVTAAIVVYEAMRQRGFSKSR